VEDVLPRCIAAKSRSSMDSSSDNDAFSNAPPVRKVGATLDWASLGTGSFVFRRGDWVVGFSGLADVSGIGGIGSGFWERFGDDLECGPKLRRASGRYPRL